LDSNLLSEVTKPSPNRKVIEWLKENESECALSPIVLGEIEYGILLLPDGKRKQRLSEWFKAGVAQFPVIGFNSDCANHWAHLLSRMKKEGVAMPLKDSLIVASALSHDLVLVTRNTRDFIYTGVDLLNPFEA